MEITTFAKATEAIEKNLEGQGSSADTTGTIAAVLKFIMNYLQQQ